MRPSAIWNIETLREVRRALLRLSFPRQADLPALAALSQGRSLLIRGPKRFGKTALRHRVVSAWLKQQPSSALEVLLTDQYGACETLRGFILAHGSEDERRRLRNLETACLVGNEPVARALLWRELFALLLREQVERPDRPPRLIELAEYDCGRGEAEGLRAELHAQLIELLLREETRPAAVRTRWVIEGVGASSEDPLDALRDGVGDTLTEVRVAPLQSTEARRYIAPLLVPLSRVAIAGRRFDPPTLLRAILERSNWVPGSVFFYCRAAVGFLFRAALDESLPLNLSLRYSSRPPETILLNAVGQSSHPSHTAPEYEY